MRIYQTRRKESPVLFNCTTDKRIKTQLSTLEVYGCPRAHHGYTYADADQHRWSRLHSRAGTRSYRRIHTHPPIHAHVKHNTCCRPTPLVKITFTCRNTERQTHLHPPTHPFTHTSNTMHAAGLRLWSSLCALAGTHTPTHTFTPPPPPHTHTHTHTNTHTHTQTHTLQTYTFEELSEAFAALIQQRHSEIRDAGKEITKLLSSSNRVLKVGDVFWCLR